MSELEETYTKICDDHIFIDEFEFDTLQGLVILDDEEYHIGINKGLPELEKRFVAEHEYSHILTNSLYYMESSHLTKLRRETKANDNMIERLHLVDEVLPLLKAHKKPYEICEELNIPNYVLWLVINYMKRKNII